MEKKRKRRHDLFTNNVPKVRFEETAFSFILSTFLATGEKKEKNGMSEETQQPSKHAMIGGKKNCRVGYVVCVFQFAHTLKSFTHRCKSLKASMN
jgi:hypothetical protein